VFIAELESCIKTSLVYTDISHYIYGACQCTLQLPEVNTFIMVCTVHMGDSDNIDMRKPRPHTVSTLCNSGQSTDVANLLCEIWAKFEVPINVYKQISNSVHLKSSSNQSSNCL
jgi:hypothetical protein